ncbi:MAG: hypothetical protein HYX94_14205 [Chloroflexi bacterium]|nr:hypothetical protein [Chloroflexota bacterium]
MPEPEDHRTLIYIPIIHTEDDMGNLGRRLPPDTARRKLKQDRWGQIQERVKSLSIDWTTAKVYQDGLPDAEVQIVNRILTEVPGPNYDLLRWLVANGAELVGTESPALIKEEYDHLQAVLVATSARAKSEARRVYADRAGALLFERDAYIARRIAQTLPPNGTALLFLGRAHRLTDHLPPDIEIKYVSPGN